MSVASSYAKALYGAAPDRTEFEAELDSMIAVLASSREARIALTCPITTAKEKVALVTGFAERLSLSPMIRQFLIVMASKGRMGLLARVRDELATTRLAAQGGIRGSLVAAEAMNPEDIQSLAKAFGKKLGKAVAFQVSTDPALLAGVKVTVNGVTYDGTLRVQLQRLRDGMVLGGVSQ